MTNDQYYALNKLIKWYEKYNHQVIHISGSIGTGLDEVINDFLTYEDFKKYEILYLSNDQTEVLSLAAKQNHAYCLNEFMYDWYKDVDLSSLAVINPKANKVSYVWKKRRNKHINKAYRIIIIPSASIVSLDELNDLCKYHLPIILISDKNEFMESDSCVRLHEPNILLRDVTDSKQKDPITYFANRILNDEVLPYGNFKTISILPKKESNKFNFKFSDIILCESNKDDLNALYRERILKHKTIITYTNEKLYLTEDTHQFVQNESENKIKVYLNKGMVGNVIKINKHTPFTRYVNMIFKPDFYDDTFELILDRSLFYDVNKSTRQLNPFESFKFNYGYALNIEDALRSHWNDITIYDDIFEDYNYHKKFLYTAIRRSTNSIVLLR